MIKLAKVIINNIESLKQNASAADTRMSDAFSKVGSDFMKVYDRFAEIEKQIKDLVINFSSGALNEPRVREIIRDILTETLGSVDISTESDKSGDKTQKSKITGS